MWEARPQRQDTYCACALPQVHSTNRQGIPEPNDNTTDYVKADDKIITQKILTYKE